MQQTDYNPAEPAPRPDTPPVQVATERKDAPQRVVYVGNKPRLLPENTHGRHVKLP